MLLEDKIIEIFCMSNDFSKFFDVMMEKYTLEEPKKRMNRGVFQSEKAFFYRNIESFSEYTKRLRSGCLTLHSQPKTKKLQATEERKNKITVIRITDNDISRKTSYFCIENQKPV